MELVLWSWEIFEDGGECFVVVFGRSIYVEGRVSEKVEIYSWVFGMKCGRCFWCV